LDLVGHAQPAAALPVFLGDEDAQVVAQLRLLPRGQEVVVGHVLLQVPQPLPGEGPGEELAAPAPAEPGEDHARTAGRGWATRVRCTGIIRVRGPGCGARSQRAGRAFPADWALYFVNERTFVLGPEAEVRRLVSRPPAAGGQGPWAAALEIAGRKN